MKPELVMLLCEDSDADVEWSMHDQHGFPQIAPTQFANDRESDRVAGLLLRVNIL